ncbi:MAG: hypothetical protein N4A49_14855 [Marinifilaceae bacterium]|jgi:hypothetical protein|nr:hypothetical protein [Marinifilaceae bacterium]
MYNNIESKKRILINLLISVLVGITVLIVAVLPAEYNIDITGLGNKLGFSSLYVSDNINLEKVKEVEEVKPKQAHRKIELKNIGSPKNVARPNSAALPLSKDNFAKRFDEVNVTVPAGKGIEYKFWAKQLGHVKYEWSTNEEELFIDFHGETKDSKGFYESYTVAYSDNMGGTFLAPFTGKHGWYFKNSTKNDIQVNIKLEGEYILMQ